MLKYYDKGMCGNNIQHNTQFSKSNSCTLSSAPESLQLLHKNCRCNNSTRNHAVTYDVAVVRVNTTSRCGRNSAAAAAAVIFDDFNISDDVRCAVAGGGGGGGRHPRTDGRVASGEGGRASTNGRRIKMDVFTAS